MREVVVARQWGEEREKVEREKKGERGGPDIPSVLLIRKHSVQSDKKEL